jgi:hypothetical protein
MLASRIGRYVRRDSGEKLGIAGTSGAPRCRRSSEENWARKEEQPELLVTDL